MNIKNEWMDEVIRNDKKLGLEPSMLRYITIYSKSSFFFSDVVTSIYKIIPPKLGTSEFKYRHSNR